MPLLNNIVSSIKIGWNNLFNDDNLTMLTFISVIYVFLIFFNYQLLSDSIFSEQVQLFGISIQAPSFFIIILTISSVASLFIGALFTKKYHRRLQLFSSMAGLAFGFLLYLSVEGVLGLIFYAIIAGFVSTIGLVNSLAAFISKTNFSNRGSSSGIFVFIVYVIIFIFVTLLTGPRELAIVLVTLKIFSLLFSVRIKEFNFDSEQKEYTITNSRIKLSFLAVWSIFIISGIAVANYLNWLVSQPNISFPIPLSGLGFITQIIGLFTIFIGGVMMDIYGRKRLLMFSFVYLGANYAIISFSLGRLNWFTILDGIAWGILTVLFLIILWGDICKPSQRAKWLAASLSISIMSFSGPLFGAQILSSLPPEFQNLNNLFPITSFFLFIAAGLILTLPETLPEKIIQKKELDDYIHTAKKIREKYAKGKKVRKDRV